MKPGDIDKHRKSGRNKLKQGKDLKDLDSDEFKVLLADVADAASSRPDIRVPGVFGVVSERMLRESSQ